MGIFRILLTSIANRRECKGVSPYQRIRATPNYSRQVRFHEIKSCRDGQLPVQPLKEHYFPLLQPKTSSYYVENLVLPIM